MSTYFLPINQQKRKKVESNFDGVFFCVYVYKIVDTTFNFYGGWMGAGLKGQFFDDLLEDINGDTNI